MGIIASAVTECQCSKDGWQFKETRIRWSEALADATWRDEEAYLNHTMPTEFWNHAFEWTNLSLPDDIRPLNLHEHWQCLGILFAKTLHSQGRIKNLWHNKDDGFIPPLGIRERFGLARDRFLNWERYLKIWPGASLLTHGTTYSHLLMHLILTGESLLSWH